MQRALFVVREDDEDGRELLAEAADLAAGVDANLAVLYVMPEKEYEEIRQTREYPRSAAEEDAKQVAERVAGEAIEGNSWEAFGNVGREARTILDFADEHDCDHLFVVGQRRSPAGKAIFGDLAQRLVLEFDGPVTTQIPER